jgi:hypothetical protein
MLGDALKDLLKKKQSGQKIEAPREREPSKVVNLMEVLRRSVETERAGGERRKPAPRTGDHRAPKKAGRLELRAAARGMPASGRPRAGAGNTQWSGDYPTWPWRVSLMPPQLRQRA